MMWFVVIEKCLLSVLCSVVVMWSMWFLSFLFLRLCVVVCLNFWWGNDWCVLSFCLMCVMVFGEMSFFNGWVMCWFLYRCGCDVLVWLLCFLGLFYNLVVLLGRVFIGRFLLWFLGYDLLLLFCVDLYFLLFWWWFLVCLLCSLCLVLGWWLKLVICFGWLVFMRVLCWLVFWRRIGLSWRLGWLLCLCGWLMVKKWWWWLSWLWLKRWMVVWFCDCSSGILVGLYVWKGFRLWILFFWSLIRWCLK